MGPTIKELELEVRDAEEALLSWVRLYPKTVAEEYLMSCCYELDIRLNDLRRANERLKELKAEMEASKNKLASNGIMFG
jgi:predicted Zn-dependent protease